jgi:hypothetical protein
MSFDTTDSSRINKDKSILCNYYDCSIYFNQYERNVNNGGYIKIPYFTPENIVKPNVLYISQEPTVKYRSNYLYIHKKTHDIKGVRYNAELIIENIPVTNGNNKVFVCFPLVTAKRKKTVLDKIIEKSYELNPSEFKTVLNLNNMFNNSQKYIFYKSGDDIVIVFTEPIQVATSFNDKYVECKMFSKYQDKYSILQNNSNLEGFQVLETFVEGINQKATNTTIIGESTMNDSSIGEYDCQPIDVTTNEVISDAPALVGINSGSSNKDKTINLLFTMLSMVIIFFTAFFAVQPLYKIIFIDDMGDATLTKSIMFSIFYLTWVIGMVAGGMMYDMRVAIFGIMFLFLWGISLLAIIIRTMFDKQYFKGKYKKDVTDTEFEGVVINDFNIITYFLKPSWEHFKNYYTNISKPQEFMWGYLAELAAIIVSIIMFIFISINSKTRPSAKTMSGKSKKDPKLAAYRNYAYSMLGIFGLGYSIFLFGPFIGYITRKP